MNKDFTIHDSNIRRVALEQLDFKKHPSLNNDKKLEALVQRCLRIRSEGFTRLSVLRSTHGSRDVYKIQTLEHELVLRLVARNIRRLTGARQSNRNTIVRTLKLLLQEGVHYNVYKFDLKSFYENVSRTALMERLERDQGFSRSHLKLLKSFFKKLDALQIVGLPRGFAISATLSEYVLKDFDKAMRERPGVFFYQRFVDDIILITDPSMELKVLSRYLIKNLPPGQSLNRHKTISAQMREQASKKNDPEVILEEISYLGYVFFIHNRKRQNDNSISRLVHADISASKTKKIKTRIVKSFRQFCEDGNFQDLIDRLKVLSGNYNIYDQGLRVSRKSGLFFNYSVVDNDNSISLPEIDLFLRRLVLGKSGPVCSRLDKKLSAKQKRVVLKFSFKRSHRQRVFYNFSSARLVELMDCWKYA